MLIYGIDAGRTGAVATLDTEQPDRIEVAPLPFGEDDLDAIGLYKLLIERRKQQTVDGGVELEPAVMVTEYTFQPLQLVMLTGKILAVSRMANATPFMVAVARWKKDMLGGNTRDKAVSVMTARQRWPSMRWRTSPQGKVWHDSCEAALLAEWGRLHVDWKLANYKT